MADDKPESLGIGTLLGVGATFLFVWAVGHRLYSQQTSDGSSEPRAGHQSDRRQTYLSAGPRSDEHNLAIIDANSAVSENDCRVKQFGFLLDSLSRKCRNGRGRIGDMAVKTHSMLTNRGVRISLMQTMAEIDASMPAESEALSLDFAEVAGLYLNLKQTSGK